MTGSGSKQTESSFENKTADKKKHCYLSPSSSKFIAGFMNCDLYQPDRILYVPSVYVLGIHCAVSLLASSPYQ